MWFMDLDAEHPEDERWYPLYHAQQGIIKFDTTLLRVHVTEVQKKGEAHGSEVLRELQDLKKPTQNANALEFLLRYQDVIYLPEWFRNYELFFWDTFMVERCSRDLYVRGMEWQSSQKKWNAIDLPLYSEGWSERQVALLNNALATNL